MAATGWAHGVESELWTPILSNQSGFLRNSQRTQLVLHWCAVTLHCFLVEAFHAVLAF